MKFTYTNAGVTAEEITSGTNQISEYIDHCNSVVADAKYDTDEASLCLAHDSAILKAVQALALAKKSPSLKYIINIGIGGSNLGTKAVYDALIGYKDVFESSSYPKMFFLDTNDPEYISSIALFLEKNLNTTDEIVVNIISKSGNTTETAVNGEIILDILKKKFPAWKERVVVTSDKGSQLWKSAESLGIATLEIPQKVGGRYSVFSPVGLFPLLMCGINIESLLSGASEMRVECLSANKENPGLTSAIILFKHLKNGLAISDNFYFHSELESLGKWYRQLMGESTGKQGMGLTPTVSMGSVDLHSVVQLYLGGPKNKITSFVYTDHFKTVQIPEKNILSHIQQIEGKEVGSIMSAIQQGTIATYKNCQLPFTETILEEISEREIGAYMQFKMMEIMFLGKLMGVNSFDQPQVELYKIETKKILALK